MQKTTRPTWRVFNVGRSGGPDKRPHLRGCNDMVMCVRDCRPHINLREYKKGFPPLDARVWEAELVQEALVIRSLREREFRVFLKAELKEPNRMIAIYGRGYRKVTLFSV